MSATHKKRSASAISGSGGGGGDKTHVSDPDHLVIKMGAVEAFKSTADAWSTLMDTVYMSVDALPNAQVSPDAGQMGVIRVQVADAGRSCISVTVIETRLEHLGTNIANIPIALTTKNLALVLKQLCGSGDLRMEYTIGEDRYSASSVSTYSRTQFQIPVMPCIGSDTPIPRDRPAKIEHVANLSVSEIRSFVSCLTALGAEYFKVHIQSDGTRVFMSIKGESSKCVGLDAEKTFFGTKGIEPPSATSMTAPLVIGGSGLRSAHILKLDENKLEQPIHVGEHENMSSEEIEDALAVMNDSEAVVDSTYTFMVRFLQAFLNKLDLKSKLTMAIVVPEGAPTCLFLRSSTPKSVTEIMLASSVSD
jgi:hypothetical protein